MIFTELKHGSSVEGDKIAAWKSEHKSTKYLYLIAGVHGDEVEGVYVLQKLFEWLKKNEDLELPIVIIPILNIDGYRVGTRCNANGIDLNRNYPSKNWKKGYREKKYFPGIFPLSEPENKFLVNLFGKFPPGLIISFHTWKPMLNCDGNCNDVANFLEKYNSYPVVTKLKNHPTPGSLGEMGIETFDCPVLTIEHPPLTDNKSLNDIWEENQKGLTELMISKIIPL